MQRTTRLLMAAGLVIGLSALAVNAQPRQPGGGFGGGFGGGGPTQLINSKTVLADLKVTDEQASKLKEWAKEYGKKQGEKMRELFKDMKDLPREEMGKKMAEIQAEASKSAYKEIGEVLKPEQVTRLKQIEVQTAGSRAFSMKNVQDALKITDEQKDKLRDVQSTSFKEMAELREEYGIKGFGGPKLDADKQKEYDKKQSAITKEVTTKIMAMLTDEQKTAWKELTGEPIDVAKIRAEGQPMFVRPKKDD